MPDSQTLGLFIAATVAGVIAIRLYFVLGRRTGNEPQPQSQPAQPSPLAQPAPQALPAPAAGGNAILEIQLADRTFDTAKFLNGAREAYKQIITAFVNGDREALRPLLSPDVFSAFDGAIGARGEAPAALVALNDARIVDAALQDRQAEITVAFGAQFATGPVTDVWTFSRDLESSDPNWMLVATSGDLPE